MTIKEVAQRSGLSHQAIYKKLKARGVSLESIKDKATGQFTPEGEALILELFPVESGTETHDATEVARLTTRVEELTTEVEKLRNQVALLENERTGLINERDFLRQTLEREQQLHGIALSKLPPALPPGDDEKGKLRSWWSKVRGKV